MQFSFSDSLGNFGLFLILEEDTKGSFITHQTSNSLSLRALLVLLLHLSHRMHIQVQFKAFKPNFSTSCCQYFGESLALQLLHFRPFRRVVKENERLSSFLIALISAMSCHLLLPCLVFLSSLINHSFVPPFA